MCVLIFAVIFFLSLNANLRFLAGDKLSFAHVMQNVLICFYQLFLLCFQLKIWCASLDNLKYLLTNKALKMKTSTEDDEPDDQDGRVPGGMCHNISMCLSYFHPVPLITHYIHVHVHRLTFDSKHLAHF